MTRAMGCALCAVALAIGGGCGDDGGTGGAGAAPGQGGAGASGGAGGSGATGGAGGATGGGGEARVGDPVIVSDGTASPISLGITARANDWAIAWIEDTDGSAYPLRYATVTADGTVSPNETLDADYAGEGPYVHNGASADDVAVSYSAYDGDGDGDSQVYFAFPDDGGGGQITNIDALSINFDHVWNETGWTVITCDEVSGFSQMDRFDFTTVPGTPIVPADPPWVDLSPYNIEDCELQLRRNASGLWMALEVILGDEDHYAVYLWEVGDNTDPIADGIRLGDAGGNVTLVDFAVRGNELAVAYDEGGHSFMEVFDQDGSPLGDAIDLGETVASPSFGALPDRYTLSWQPDGSGPADLLVGSWDPDGTPGVGPLVIDTKNDVGPAEPEHAALGDVMGITYLDEALEPSTMDRQVWLARVPDL